MGDDTVTNTEKVQRGQIPVLKSWAEITEEGGKREKEKREVLPYPYTCT